jgi:signal transduction histidine kinase/CheY-like chemotaxis protein
MFFSIGQSLYRQMPRMGSTVLLQILVGCGLNLIMPLTYYAANSGDGIRGPAFLLSDRLSDLPVDTFNAALRHGDTLWLGGGQLYRQRAGGAWQTIDGVAGVAALAVDPATAGVWFGGSGGLGYVEAAAGAGQVVNSALGFVWDVRVWRGRVWHFGSNLVGWVEPRTGERRAWALDVHPRPFVIGPWAEADRLFVAGEAGLWEVSEDGVRGVLDAEATGGQPITWGLPQGAGFQLGTARGVMAWDGQPRSAVEWVHDHQPTPYFARGIANGSEFSGGMAIVDYPTGVALWDAHRLQVSGYVDRRSGMAIGDAYKISAVRDGQVIVLGTAGAATLDLESEARFFPESELGVEWAPRHAFEHEGHLHVFTRDYWMTFDHHGFERRQLPQIADWAALDDSGSPAYGTLYLHHRWAAGDWQELAFGTPVHDVVWQAGHGFALGAEGLYAVGGAQRARLLLRLDQRYRLLGVLGSAVYAVDAENRLVAFRSRGAGWAAEPTSHELAGRVHAIAAATGQIAVATDSGVYLVAVTGVHRWQLAPGWVARGLAANERTVVALLEHRATGQLAVAEHDGRGTRMLEVKGLSLIGEARLAVSGASQFALVGTAGVLMQPRATLPQRQVPEFAVRILHAGRRVDGRRLKAGTSQLEVTTANAGTAIPVQTEFRINDGSWQVTGAGRHPIPVAGHGRFVIEARAVHPDGAASAVRAVHFTIAPPWYLSFYTQMVAVGLVLGLTWLFFYLRNAQLERTNRWLAAEVKKQTQQLELATAARTQFLAGISHDIRNPLSGILLISESLSLAPPAAADDPRLGQLRDLGMVVDQMLGEVLDFAVIDRAAIPLNPVPVPVSDVVLTAVRQNQWLIDRSLINLTTRIPDEVRDLAINADQNWLVQVLSNLIVNAVHYSQSESIVVGISLLEKGDATAVLELYVKDWGIGIPDPEKEQVFERFYRGESGIDSGRHGTGLGLAICREVVAAIGGELTISDNQPSGACFRLVNRYELADTTAVIDHTRVLQSLAGRRLLVVEDLDYNREAMVRFLEMWGARVEAVANGSVALQRMIEQRYDLVLLDWDLPGLTGPQVAARFRQRCRDADTTIIAMTAYTDLDKKAECLRVGMNGYLAKPLTAQRLAQVLSAVDSRNRRVMARPRDTRDPQAVLRVIDEQIEACLTAARDGSYDKLRVAAHKLTTLAMVVDDRPLQQVCRTLQELATARNLAAIDSTIPQLRQWKTKG